MSVITIRGQLGSGAPEIGQLLATRLGYDFVDRQIIAQVAEKVRWNEAGIIEKEMPPGSLIGRVMGSLAQAYQLGPGRETIPYPIVNVPPSDTQYFDALRCIVENLAAMGSLVICGRGSQFILKDYQDILHMLLVAPFELRTKRVMQSFNVEEASAKKEISRYDSSRREFIRRYFQADLEDAANYDLVINTASFSYDATVSLIINALPVKKESRNTADSVISASSS
jgi:cytidylate kinase